MKAKEAMAFIFLAIVLVPYQIVCIKKANIAFMPFLSKIQPDIMVKSSIWPCMS